MARRFEGRFKPGLSVGERTILDRQTAEFRAAGIEQLTLVGGRQEGGLELHRVADACAGGALAGIYTALLAAVHPVVVVVAGDMPFVTARALSLLSHLDGHDAAVPFEAGRWHPLCAAYHRRVAPRLQARLNRNEWRVTDALDDLRVRTVRGPELDRQPARLLFNVNTLDLHREAERLASL